MSKEKSWVDYANLASSVEKNVQLSGLSSQLARQQQTIEYQLELEKEQNDRREGLWAVKTKLAEVLEQYADKPAQQMLILTKLLKNVDSVNSGLFDKWEDKERLEEIKKSGRQAFKDIKQKIGESEMLVVNNALLLVEKLPELRKKTTSLLEIKELNERAGNKLGELKSIEAQIAIQISPKHKIFKKATIVAAVLCAVSFIFYFVLTAINQHKEDPHALTPSELIAGTFLLCFLMLQSLFRSLGIFIATNQKPKK